MNSVPRITRVSSAPSRRRGFARAAVAVSGAAALVLAAAGGASAHVTVHSADAKPGGSGTLVFKVPNEESNATTTKVEIDLPTDTKLSGVTAQAPAGWQATVNDTQIVFSGGTIAGDNDQEFPIKVGTLPTADKVVFKAIQTYSNGDVVRWIEQSAAGGPEPAHPAPTLDLKNPNAVDDDDEAHPTAGPSSDSKSGDMGGMDMSSMSGAGMAAMTSSSTPSPSAVPSASSSSTSSPTSVHAGTGGQAADGRGIPVAPLPFVLAGLAVAAYGARRLLRG